MPSIQIVCAPAAAPAPAEVDPTAYDDEDDSGLLALEDVSLARAATPPRPAVPRLPPVTPSAVVYEATQGSDRPTMDGATDAIAWLYSQGKSAFERQDYSHALQSFEFCLEKLGNDHARQSAPFDAERTLYRHLDDYLSFCRTREAANRRRSPEAQHTGGAPTPPPHHSSTGSPTKLAAVSLVGNGGIGEGPSRRNCLIFVCSPHALPLPHLADEAVDVANVISSHIRRGGSAGDLRNELLAHRYKAFLFSGHGDAELEGSDNKTLGFTSPTGGLDTVRAEHLAELLGAHSPSKHGCLETVFINGCMTEQIGRQVRDAGVPYVICWQTKAHDRAARVLASTFFASLSAGRAHFQAFDDARTAVKLATRPGRTFNGMPSSVPTFELRWWPQLTPRSMNTARLLLRAHARTCVPGQLVLLGLSSSRPLTTSGARVFAGIHPRRCQWMPCGLVQASHHRRWPPEFPSSSVQRPRRMTDDECPYFRSWLRIPHHFRPSRCAVSGARRGSRSRRPQARAGRGRWT